jgi:hypothetical protein
MDLREKIIPFIPEDYCFRCSDFVSLRHSLKIEEQKNIG